MVKDLLMTPTDHELKCEITNVSEFESEGYVEVKVQITNGGGEALGALSYKEAAQMAKWFTNLAEKMKPKPKKKLKTKEAKRGT